MMQQAFVFLISQTFILNETLINLLHHIVNILRFKFKGFTLYLISKSPFQTERTSAFSLHKRGYLQMAYSSSYHLLLSHQARTLRVTELASYIDTS